MWIHIVDMDNDTDDDSELDDGAYEDTVICFRGNELSLGPCYAEFAAEFGICGHCCRVWSLKPIYSSGPKMDFLG